MKGKIIVCFVMILMMISIFGNIVTTQSKAIGISKDASGYSKPINYIIDEQHPSKPPLEYEIKIQEPTYIKESGFVYEPPWSSHWWDKEKEIYGVCDAWQEGSQASGEYAKTRVQTWAGGAGYTLIRVWLCQGFYFCPPKTTTYTIDITHSAEGLISGSTYGIHAGSACNSRVYFFFMTGIDNYERLTIKDEWSYFGGPGYSEIFNEEITQTYELELEEGEVYWIGSQTLMGDWCEGFGLSYASTDSETTGDHSRLKKIVINFDNDPPAKPKINGMTNGNPGTSYAYGFASIDPEGRDVYFIIDWGDGKTECTNYVCSGQFIYTSHTWSSSGAYNIRAKAKDQEGFESDWATLSVTMPKNKAIHNLPHILKKQDSIICRILNQIIYF